MIMHCTVPALLLWITLLGSLVFAFDDPLFSLEYQDREYKLLNVTNGVKPRCTIRSTQKQPYVQNDISKELRYNICKMAFQLTERQFTTQFSINVCGKNLVD